MFSEVVEVKQSGGAVSYYSEGTTTNLYVNVSFGAPLTSLTISNDSSDELQFSFDGATLDGNLLANEDLTVNVQGKRSIYIKGTAGGGDYRIWGF